MKFLLLASVALFYSFVANSQSRHVKFIDPTYLSLEYRDFGSSFTDDWYPLGLGIRDSYLSPLDKEIRYGLGLNFDFDVIRYKKYAIFHRNEWAFSSTPSHVRHVYWEYRFGFKISDFLEVFHYHKSQHILEAEREDRFPVRDSFNIRLIFINK